MKEAFRLLSKSIIRVETPDINLEEDDNAPQADDQMDMDETEQLRITFEEYKKISNMMIMHMREYEEKNRG